MKNKFIEEINTDDWEIETPTGWQSFSGIGKTVEYTEWILKTESGKELICADDHIVILDNEYQIFVSDLEVGNKILTRDGLEKVTQIEETKKSSNMFDVFDVDDGSVFYTNDIVSHNSTTATGYILHQMIFNDNYTIGILANKLSMSKEIIARLQLAYEKLPKWIQHGIVAWNKGSIELENGSSVLASSTSSSAVRGYSFNTIFLDEFAFVPEHIANEFFTSTYPTISAGKSTKIIITSTPCGYNLFYKIWDEAVRGINEFKPFEINWWDVPGRDEKFKEETIKNIGSERWEQEYNCAGGDTFISIYDTKEDKYKTVKIEDLYENYNKNLNHRYKIQTPYGYVDFDGIRRLPKKQQLYFVKTENNSVEVTKNHEFVVNHTSIKCSELSIGDYLQTPNGLEKVLEIKKTEVIDYVYDVLEVKNPDRSFFANNLLHHNCSFLGSSDTLIEGSKLANITTTPPLKELDGLAIFEQPKEDGKYLITVDVARGTNQDYSAFLIFDISGIPYKVVGRYKHNKIKPIVFPSVIKRLAVQYNNANVLIEINDIGQQVAEILYMDLEYEHVMMCAMRGRAGQVLGGYFSSKAQYGVKMSTSTKKVGCSNLKTLIESDRLTFTDYEILEELTRYVRHNKTFKAESGYHDDLCACLVIFAWASTQTYFKDIASSDVREHLYEEKKKIINNQLMPFGFADNGVEIIPSLPEKFIEDGDLWMNVSEDTSLNLGLSYLE